MLGQLVQRFSLSPVTSPLASPKSRRRPAKSLAARRSLKEEFREIQSEPEDGGGGLDKKPRSKRRIEKLKGRRLEVSAPLHGSKSMGRLDGLKQVHRLAQYEEYFENLLSDVHGDQIRDLEELQTVHSKARQIVKRAQEESDLERIQDLFPNDYLRLYDKDVLTMRMKGLMRKRSSTAARLTRALSAKSLRPESPPPPRQGPPQTEKRQFIMETKVQFTAGVQSQERHLFLFNDLLLIAKARSGGNFKLKEKVRVSEIWLSLTGIEEVCEVTKSKDTSFILGWPTTNVVATFSTQAARDLWWSKLTEIVNVEKAKEPCTTNVQVIYFDQATSIEYCKTFSVGPDETARSCISMALDHLDLMRDPDGYQLWAKTARDEAPYPLLGHERPFAIKLSCLRDSLSAEEGFDLDHCNNVHDPLARCQFILRSVCKTPDNEKKTPKKSNGRIRIGQVFKRSLSKENSGCLFALPLQRICPNDQLPRPVMNMLQQVFIKGPFIQGIFRKSANVRLVRELREKLDRGEEVNLEHVPVPVVASLLKEFLRSLPDPLLSTALYPRWRAALEAPNIHQRMIRLKGVLEDLPKLNRLLLYHVLCVLHHVGRRSGTNLMSPTNLGVCVGPSLLWSDSVTPGDLRAVPLLVETFITHCEFLCGPRVTHLLGDPRDSGTEESDSLKRDDSSIDSLECSPPPRKDKISLSRDSGLTMSDSQLYTPDEEESGSTSSSGYDPAFDPHAKVTPTMSVPAEYVRVYGGWEERINPNFQRQAWFRQRSRRLNSIPQTKTEVRRSASEESLLDSPAPPTPPRQIKPDLKPFDEMFNRHPPLRKVTAVHCEVISEPRRRQYRETVYATKKPLSVSSADLTRLRQFPQRPSLPALPQHRFEEQEDSSTLSDDDCTPQVSRSNSRGNEVTPRHRYLPPVHVETSYIRGRLRSSSERPAHRSRSLPPPQQPLPNNINNKRAPITSYYLPEVTPYIVTRAYRDEESYV